MSKTSSVCLLGLQMLWWTGFAVASGDQAPANEPRYHTLLTHSSRETFERILKYCREHPDAADLPTALGDLYSLARTWGWEADAREISDSLLKRPELEAGLTREILAVSALGAARAGDRDAAHAAYDEYLRSLRLRNPNAATELAQSLALVWQLKSDAAAAAGVYSQLSTAFFLNPEVRAFAEARTRRLSLVGTLPSEFSATDLSGQKLTTADLRGKVVLLDFWATNCRPCLEELPRLRQIYRDCRPLGLEIVGISFDEERAAVEQFLMQEPLPWRLTLARQQAEEQFHVHLIPCLMLVDRQGRIVATDVHPFDLRRTVESLLKQQ